MTLRTVLHLAVAVGLATSAAACARARAGESLMPTVTSYNDSVRWGRLATAANHLPPSHRSEFIDARDQLAEDLLITDYELVRVTAQGDAAAEVHVKYVWYLESEGVVHTTHANQAWEHHGRTWLIVDEVRLRGTEMPGLAEPSAEQLEGELEDDRTAARL